MNESQFYSTHINGKGYIIVWQANVNKFSFIEIVNWNSLLLECLLYSIMIITWARSKDDKNLDLFTVDKQFNFWLEWGFEGEDFEPSMM